jgi:hypothetical protein
MAWREGVAADLSLRLLASEVVVVFVGTHPIPNVSCAIHDINGAPFSGDVDSLTTVLMLALFGVL